MTEAHPTPVHRLVASALLSSLIVAGCGLGSGGYATAEDLQGPWRAEPLPVDPATIAAAERACRERTREIAAPKDRLVAVDARGGNRIFLIFTGPPASSSACELRLDAAGNVSIVGASGSGADAPFEALARGDVVIMGSDGGGNGNNAWASVIGRTGSAVAVVRVLAPGGASVRASASGGWFYAWWPASQFGFTVEAFDATGQKVGEARQ